MPFKPAKCPNCAGDLQVPDDRDAVKCMYCGSDIMVREAIKLAGGINIDNLLFLAANSEKVERLEEAYKYYAAVLESDPQNCIAWVGKGFTERPPCIADEAHLRMCLNNALSFSPNKEELRNEIVHRLELLLPSNVWSGTSSYWVSIVNVLNEIAPCNITGLIGKGVQHLKMGDPDFRYLSHEEERRTQRKPELRDCITFFEKAIETSSYADEVKETILNIIVTYYRRRSDWDEGRYNRISARPYKYLMLMSAFLCRYEGARQMPDKVKAVLEYADNIDITKCSPEIRKELYALKQDIVADIEVALADTCCSIEDWFKSTSEPYLLSLKQKYNQELGNTDRTDKINKVEETIKSQQSKCFIATAAFGSPFSQEVLVLREFRDRYLETTSLGRAFVRSYYRTSPPIARAITVRQSLRVAVQKLLNPLVSCVSVFMKHEKG
jgi:DNA-directed RNA polymerase subunit RPC12/RpoP